MWSVVLMLHFRRRMDVCTRVLGWKEFGALEDPKGDQGAADMQGDGQRVDTLREMSRTSSSRAFPTPLRNWEFKPPFQMKHSECANSPLKVLS